MSWIMLGRGQHDMPKHRSIYNLVLVPCGHRINETWCRAQLTHFVSNVLLGFFCQAHFYKFFKLLRQITIYGTKADYPPRSTEGAEHC